MAEDAGYAFPLHGIDGPTWEGMTLRDWFASQALNGALARTTMPDYELSAIFGKHRTGITREEIIAADAYRIADAMIRRSKQP